MQVAHRHIASATDDRQPANKSRVWGINKPAVAWCTACQQQRLAYQQCVVKEQWRPPATLRWPALCRPAEFALHHGLPKPSWALNPSLPTLDGRRAALATLFNTAWVRSWGAGRRQDAVQGRGECQLSLCAVLHTHRGEKPPMQEPLVTTAVSGEGDALTAATAV